MMQQRSEFALTDPPPELWSRISKLAVILDHSPTLTVNELRVDWCKILQQPGITQRAIRRESLSHYYSHNTFIVHDTSSNHDRLNKWLKAIGETHCGHIKWLCMQTALGD